MNASCTKGENTFAFCPNDTFASCIRSVSTVSRVSEEVLALGPKYVSKKPKFPGSKWWMFICLPVPGADVSVDQFSPTEEECIVRVKEIIGDDSVKVGIKDVSKWWINEIVAEYYSDGNV